MLKGKSMSEIFVISIERIITFLFFCAAGYVLYAKDMVPKSSTETISKISLQVMISGCLAFGQVYIYGYGYRSYHGYICGFTAGT